MKEQTSSPNSRFPCHKNSHDLSKTRLSTLSIAGFGTLLKILFRIHDASCRCRWIPREVSFALRKTSGIRSLTCEIMRQRRSFSREADSCTTSTSGRRGGQRFAIWPGGECTFHGRTSSMSFTWPSKGTSYADMVVPTYVHGPLRYFVLSRVSFHEVPLPFC